MKFPLALVAAVGLGCSSPMFEPGLCYTGSVEEFSGAYTTLSVTAEGPSNGSCIFEGQSYDPQTEDLSLINLVGDLSSQQEAISLFEGSLDSQDPLRSTILHFALTAQEASSVYAGTSHAELYVAPHSNMLLIGLPHSNSVAVDETRDGTIDYCTVDGLETESCFLAREYGTEDLDDLLSGL